MYAVYDENEIGALDCDEIEGHVAPDSDLVLQCATEFEKTKKQDVSIRAQRRMLLNVILFILI